MMTSMRIDRRSCRQCCIFLIWILLCGPKLYGAFDWLPSGSRSASMGLAYTAVAEGPEALCCNPAGMVQSHRFASSFHTTRLYGMKPLTLLTAAAILPLKFGHLGCRLQRFGQSLYQENTLLLAYAAYIHPRIALAINLRMAHLRIENYSSSGHLLWDCGILVHLSRSVRLGAAVSNITLTRLKNENDPLPQWIKTGISLQPHPKLLASFELDKDVRHPAECGFGLEFHPLKPLYIRTGFRTEPSSCTAGIGILHGRFSLDYACLIHPVLGLTHMGGISFR